MKTININHAKRCMVITKSFSIKASEFGSSEYEAMKDLRKDFPDYKVRVKEIKRNPHKKTYAKLTYENMKKHIEHVEGGNSESIEKLDTLIEAARIQPSPYAYVKKWFLENYSDYRDYGAVIGEGADNDSSNASAA